MSARDTQDWLGLAREGTAHLDRIVAGIDDADLAGPSLLPGWTRAHVLAHVGYNALALSRLAEWGRTGVENRMYASTEQRDEEIMRGGELPPAEIRSLAERAAQTLAQAWESLSEDAWSARIVTAQGVDRPVSDTPWMRNREVWIHAVDLGTGARFSDMPHALQERLLAEIWGLWGTRGQNGGLSLEVIDGPTYGDPATEAETVVVRGPLAGLARWAAGRGAEPHAALEVRRGGEQVSVPEPPRWL